MTLNNITTPSPYLRRYNERKECIYHNNNNNNINNNNNNNNDNNDTLHVIIITLKISDPEYIEAHIQFSK